MKSLEHHTAESGNGADLFARKRHIVIPDDMTKIEPGFFKGNRDVVSIRVPGHVKTIGQSAFADCPNLETVILEEGITQIFERVFSNCPKLKGVTIPDSLKISGLIFKGAVLKESVTNASGTILYYCPRKLLNGTFIIPDGIVRIAGFAFDETEGLTNIVFPNSLETICASAFYHCDFSEVVIPAWIRYVHESAFSCCQKLKRVTICGKETIVRKDSFVNCPLLEEICWDFEQTPDHKFHFENKSFLEQHLDARANLGHTKDLHFIKLVAECAKGNPDSLNEMADYFESMAAVPGASAFYIYASNYWRYRAFSKGNLSARSWFDKWFAANPGKRLPSILRENSYGREGRYKHEIEGKMLNDLGFPFFDAKRYYEIKILDSVGLAEVSAFSDYDGPDESGFGAETFYDWWYLDENLTPIPGVHSIHSRSVRDKRTFSEDFHIQYQKAANAVRSRKLERPSEHCQD